MYCKLFSSICESSLMDEDLITRYVFVFMLALADEEGHVSSTKPALARRLNIPLDDLEHALEQLQKPDPSSKSKAEQGRRVVRYGSQLWHIVNYEKYRNIATKEDRRRKDRERKREARKNSRTTPSSGGSNDPIPEYSQNSGSIQKSCPQTSADVRECPPSEADAYANTSLSSWDDDHHPTREEGEKEMSDGQTRETTVTSSPSDDHSAIRSVHDRWVETNNRNPAETELTPGRVAIIRARLSDCTFDQVIRAVEACGDSPYHQGQNPSGNVYNDLEQHILCSREKVEWWLHRTPPVKSADTFDYDTFFDRWEEENRQPTREELLAEAHERRKRRQEREARENELTAVA